MSNLSSFVSNPPSAPSIPLGEMAGTGDAGSDRVVSSPATDGRDGRQFVAEMFRRSFDQELATALTPIVDGATHDSALIDLQSSRVAVTTESYVVTPLFFSGGNIGDLAVYGSINNLATIGALARAITVSFLLEDGLPLAQLQAVVESMAAAASHANVRLLVGDTKVVERGRGNGVFITTTALGTLPTCNPWHAGRIQEGDVVLVSGDLGRHGAAVLAAQGSHRFTDVEGSPLTSDVGSVWPCISELLGFSGSITSVRVLTRGLASTLVKLSEQSGLSLAIVQSQLPLHQAVTAACETLNLDPLELASQGRVVMMVRPEAADAVLTQLKRFEPTAAIVGRATNNRGETPMVLIEQTSGTERVLGGQPDDLSSSVR